MTTLKLVIGEPEKVGVERSGLEQAIKLLEEQGERGLHEGLSVRAKSL